MTGKPTDVTISPRYSDAGAWLRKQRQHWQITQAELAEQVGAHDVSLIEDFEQGRIALPVDMHDAIAVAYGVDPVELSGYCANWYGSAISKAA